MTAVSREVEVISGRMSRIRFEIPYGVPVKLRYPPVARDRYELRTVWRNGTGQVVYESGGMWDRREESRIVTHLISPGRYSVEISDASGAKATIEVVASDPPNETVYDLPSLHR